MSDDEDDFMSDKFLTEQSTSSKQPMSYADRRRKAINKGIDKGINLTRKEREAIAREEGLNRNLIIESRLNTNDSSGKNGASASGTSETANAGDKALAMMRKMGFKPGQALGKRKDSPEPEPSLPSSSNASRSQSPAVPPPEKKARTEPIPVHLRTNRAGLGTSLPPKKYRHDPSVLTDQELTSKEDYLSTRREAYDDRRAEGILNGARRTCEELDRRAGIEKSVMWLDPREVSRDARRKLIARRMGERVVSDDEEEEDSYQELKGLKAGFDDEILEEDEKSSKDEWLEMDARTRLEITLKHLREKHDFCIWCGTAYDSAEDMKQNCPGEEESDH